MEQTTGAKAPLTGLAPALPVARWITFLAVIGPGLVVMLADTDVGSIVTAAQSGARWGYRLLLLQVVLIPVLFIVQELTVRLGIFTGKGHGELIRETFGPVWAWVSVSGLAVAVIGAIVTEFAGVAAAGDLFGVPRWLTLSLAAGFLLIVVWTGSYRRVERVAIALGLFELLFVAIAIGARPNLPSIAAALAQQPLGDPAYQYLVAANIGAVIMPWMIFYQQSAVVDKRLQPEDYRAARWDTAIGAGVTQLIMAAVIVTAAATLGHGGQTTTLNTVGQIATALTPLLGSVIGKIIFSLGIIGAGLIAAIVVSLAMAWGFGEVMGFKHSLEHHPLQAPRFYLIYSAGIVGGAVLVALAPNLVTLSIGVQVLNALLLPLVLGLLVALAIKCLPRPHRLSGPYAWLVIFTVLVTTALGVYGGLPH